MHRSTPTTERLSRNCLDKTFLWIVAEDEEER
jgi:hypothetical protein